MKVYEIAAVIDRGNYYEVEYVTSNLTKELRSSQRYLGLNSSAAIMIKKGLANDRNIRIIKDFKDLEVHIHDIIVEEEQDSELDKYKKIYIKKARQDVTHQQAMTSGIMLYDYMNINNYLNDKGYFIHDDNKEETFLKILETEDEVLITKLELYLNARESISRTSHLEHQYFKYYEDIKNALNEEEVLKIFTLFMDMLKNVKQL
ncbi:MAG: hypothetical protein DRG78_18045 [Epsilonproteobacteria bacterium]|nr:MAG: hypothetical protein DRG78_18045 [Campylobacterota bacterium]